MSPTIHFESRVFKHHGDFDLQLTGIYDPDLTHASHEVFKSYSHVPEDLADSAACLDLDYDGLDEDIDPYEGRQIYMATWDNTQATTEAGSSASRPPPCLSNTPTINTISP